MQTLNVQLGERSYPIHIGAGVLTDPALWSACLSNVATTGGMERLLVALHQVSLAALTGLVVDLADAAAVPLDKPLTLKNPERN